MKILNSFSLNMLGSCNATLQVKEITLEEVKATMAEGFESAVGHADTAAIFSQQLGVDVLVARINVSLVKGETILVGQYKGPRLPEGCKELPAGSTIQWCLVTVN